jgi:hypothetical protein
MGGAFGCAPHFARCPRRPVTSRFWHCECYGDLSSNTLAIMDVYWIIRPDMAAIQNIFQRHDSFPLYFSQCEVEGEDLRVWTKDLIDCILTRIDDLLKRISLTPVGEHQRPRPLS